MTSVNDQVKKVLTDFQTQAASSGSVTPLCFAFFGNAKKKTSTLLSLNGTGTSSQPGAAGTTITNTTLFRMGDMTKLLAPIAFAMVSEMYPDEITLDTLAYTFIPELSQINKRYSYNGKTGAVEVVTESSSLGNSITLRHLLTGESGLGYQFFGLGASSQILSTGSDSTSMKIYNKFYSDASANNFSVDTIYQSFNSKGQIDTFTQSIQKRCQFPLLFRPGAYNQNTTGNPTVGVYDTGLTYLTAFLSAFVKSKGQYTSLLDMMNKTLFLPLEINNIFFNCGSFPPPADKVPAIADAYFCRSSTFTQGIGSGIVANQMYSVYNVPSGSVKDGFVYQSVDVYTKPTSSDDKYAGGFDWSCLCSLNAYAKIVSMLMSGGIYFQKQILSKAVVNWVLAPKNNPPTMSVCGPGTADLLKGRNWCYGFAQYDTGNFPYTPFQYTWDGYFGTTVNFDINTGNFSITGSQISGSSYMPKSSSVTQPNANKIWKIINTRLK